MEGGGARAQRAPPARCADSRALARIRLRYGSAEGHARAAACRLTAADTRNTFPRARGAPAGG